MKTPSSKKPTRRTFRAFSPIALAVTFLASAIAEVHAADMDRRSTAAPAGYHKVVQSSDPMFPEATNKEWFLDFGQAIQRGKTSGTVAVSMRENPSVKVRLLVWQLFPETGTLVIGANEEGSNRAVALASWQVDSGANGIVLQRNQYQISLQRAQATD